MICKILGLVDISAAILLMITIETPWKYLLVVPLFIKGIPSLLG